MCGLADVCVCVWTSWGACVDWLVWVHVCGLAGVCLCGLAGVGV